MRIVRCLLLAALLAIPAARVAAACRTFDHDHAAWSAILERWVNDGRVAYAGLRDDGRASLEGYLDDLSTVCVEDYEGWSRDERLAFWINTYNAFTVELILRHYPISSIRKIGWLPGAAFREAFIPMAGLKGGKVSLGDIEHATLRADFREPRIHFALVCAARSCPPLRGEAYRASVLERQLDDQARAFLGDESKNRFDAATRTLHLSRIFDWFRADFEAVAGSLPALVSRILDDPRVRQPGVKVEFLEYDWSLNDQPTAP